MTIPIYNDTSLRSLLSVIFEKFQNLADNKRKQHTIYLDLNIFIVFVYYLEVFHADARRHNIFLSMCALPSARVSFALVHELQ